MLYSVDRFEGDLAVLVDDDGNSHTVERHLLPAMVEEGTLLRQEGEGYVADRTETATRRAHVLALQKRLRRE